jgi:hypothetical protein
MDLPDSRQADTEITPEMLERASSALFHADCNDGDYVKLPLSFCRDLAKLALRAAFAECEA